MIILLTGTDTEIGKTMVGAGLARALSDRRLNVQAIKPVESGTGEAVGPDEDGVRLAEASRQDEPTCALTRLREPLAPPVAADIDQVDLDFDDWCKQILVRALEAEVTIVEGAGGVLSPLTWRHTARELAHELGAGVLLVAPNRLGALNHTLMALEVLHYAELPVGGVVLSDVDGADHASDSNLETLRRFAGFERVVRLPHVGDWAEAAEHLSEVVDWIVGDLEAPDDDEDGEAEA